MDNYISNDFNNPINWNGSNIKCSECSEELTMDDFADICSDCFNKEEPTKEEEERKELEKQFLKFPDLEK